MYNTSSLFVTHTDVQYFLEDFAKKPKISENTNKFPVKVIDYLIAEFSGCFTVMVEMVRVRFWLYDADPSWTKDVKCY
jgi:hypothetical protein